MKHELPDPVISPARDSLVFQTWKHCKDSRFDLLQVRTTPQKGQSMVINHGCLQRNLTLFASSIYQRFESRRCCHKACAMLHWWGFSSSTSDVNYRRHMTAKSLWLQRHSRPTKGIVYWLWESSSPHCRFKFKFREIQSPISPYYHQASTVAGPKCICIN